MTQHLPIEIRLRSPLCIARRPTAPGQPVETLPYLSGTVVRGAVATAWLKGARYEELSDVQKLQFQTLFLSPGITFHNCWPSTPGATTRVVPKTAWTQKYGGGWIHDDPPGSGVIDHLATFLQRRMPEPHDGIDRYDHLFYTEMDGEAKHIEIRKRLIARTAIESVRGTTRDGQLYTLESLETNQTFSGTITFDAPLVRVLEQQATAGIWKDLTQACGQEQITHPPHEMVKQLVACLQQSLFPEGSLWTMGQGRSRGLGQVTLRHGLAPDDPADDHASLTANVHTFTAIVRRTGNVPLDTDLPSDTDLLLPVTLESDMVLRDKYLLSSSDAQPTVTLGRYLPLPQPLADQMHLVRRGVVQSVNWLSGWDELRRVPRPPQMTVAIGSVWTFRVAPDSLDAAIDWWLQAQHQGLGERRNEGFGRVRLCHPLHRTEGFQ